MLVSRLPGWVPFAVALLTLTGCGKSAANPTGHATAKADGETAEVREIWEAFYLQNSKIGYGQTTIRSINRDGKPLVETDSLTHLDITRFGQRTEQDLKMTTWETPAGELLEFETTVSFGPSPLEVTGKAAGDRMVIETQTKGSKQTSQIPWSSDIGGFRAVEQSLERQPLKPGERRTLKMIMPVLNQVADVELVARDDEATNVLGAEARLQRIESIARLPDGNEMASTLWIDRAGETVKTRMDAMQQESFRTSRDLAVAEQVTGAGFDLGIDVIVKPDHPLQNAHHLKQAKYRVELIAGDPAKVFATGATQSVQSLGPHTAELMVRSLRPGHSPSAIQPDKAVAKEYTGANSTLQIDDPRIRAMAQEARGANTDPTAVAVALEKYVHDKIAKKNFSQAFATAAEVAESREGDCTEHAVLLAALARASHIPSRVAIGLVYTEQAEGFGYHMWTEVYLDGQWIPLDATLGEGGIGAAHLKLADSSLDGPSAYSSFLPVAQVVGQLKVNVLETQPDAPPP